MSSLFSGTPEFSRDSVKIESLAAVTRTLFEFIHRNRKLYKQMLGLYFTLDRRNFKNVFFVFRELMRRRTHVW